jgi:hypothetical protein
MELDFLCRHVLMVERHVGLDGASPSLVACPQEGMTAQAMSFVVRLTIQEKHRRAQLERSETLSTCHLLYFPQRTVSFNGQRIRRDSRSCTLAHPCP